MKLYDEKKLSLNSLLNTYIPELSKTDKADLTIQDALFHETGLPPFLPFYQSAIDENSYDGLLCSPQKNKVFHLQLDKKTFVRTDFKYIDSLVSFVKKPEYPLQVANHFYLSDRFPEIIMQEIISIDTKKKGAYLYSDLNFILLKEVVEKCTKKKFDSYLDSVFYRKLGARNTLFNPLQRIDTLCIAPTENDQFLRKQQLVGFVHDEAAAFMGGVSGNSGLFSNANNLAKICQMFLNEGTYGGDRFFSSETTQLFTKTKSPKSRRGLGFDKPETDQKKVNPCSDSTPASSYGHTGFTGTCFWVDPENKIIYIFLSNRVHPSRINNELTLLNIRSRIQEIIYEAIMR